MKPLSLALDRLVFFLIPGLLLIAGCLSSHRPSDFANSPAFVRTQMRWQEAIDAVVAANFPADYGKYKAIVWGKPFDNAWVTKGREVNITQQLASKLGRSHLICVAAHELAHLKMGHYYAKVGIIIVNPDTNQLASSAQPLGHYGATRDFAVPEGFGKNQEKEADRLALRFIYLLGLPSQVYLGLLNGFLKTDTHARSLSSMADRIRFLQFQEHLLDSPYRNHQ